MMKKMKKNNKGFSLVELIVVMAIMAILAVTLAPRLMQYVDKARQANDREMVNNIYSAVQYALVDDSIYADVASAGNPVSGPAVQIQLNGGKDTSTSVTGDDPYNVSTDGKTWAVTTNVNSNKFMYEVLSVVGSFKLQSTLTKPNPQITITIYSQTKFTVQLDYNTSSSTTFDYTLDSSTAS